FATYYCQQSYS
nr:immunoglobulin light chain junction region [Homo sapiens]